MKEVLQMWTLIKKEIVSGFLELRFQILTVAVVLLTILVVTVDVSEYKRRLDAYYADIKANQESIRKTKVYSMLTPKAIKPPQVMSIVSQGVELDVGNTVQISPPRIQYEATNIYNNNPYISVFSKLDVSIIFLWILSLAALLMSFDAVSGEKENGTLKLMLVGRVSRAEFLLSKYLVSLLSVSFLAIISIGIVMSVFAISTSIDFTSSLFVKFMMIFAVVLLYEAIWVGIGAFLSLICKSSATSLMGCLAVWVFFLIVVPNIINHLGDHIDLDKGREILQHEEEQITAEFQENKFKLQELAFSNVSMAMFTWYEPGEEQIFIEGANPETVSACKRYFRELYPLILEYAQKKHRATQRYFLQPFKRKVRLVHSYSILSPFSLTKILIMKVAQTSYEDYLNFLDQTVNYRNQILDYLHRKRAAESVRWFTPDPEDNPMYSMKFTPEEIAKLSEYYRKVANDQSRFLTLDDLPVFKYRWNKNQEILKDILPYTSLLVGSSAFLMFLGFWKIRKYDVA
ncbi:MAG: hypothetical protein DRQ24_05570 [Candidatus Latescibacterota bacterium]|nr:MAG: hypothetical protein DRQ24_05570 [Candidatus Latescibacterota bacterium]